MYKNTKVLAIITARGGSKGIPRKNIKDLAGKPLIAYTIAAANASQHLTRTIVSTDDEEISTIAKDHGGGVPFLRPAHLAEDESKSIDVISDLVTTLVEQGDSYDYIMILQPTSPLRTSGDIDAAIEMAVDNDADSVMSMVELSDFSKKKIKKISDSIIEPFFEAEGNESSRRQDLEPAYKRNCAIYLTRTDLIMQGDLFGEKSVAYIMPEERSVDINTPYDFSLTEFLLQ